MLSSGPYVEANSAADDDACPPDAKPQNATGPSGSNDVPGSFFAARAASISAVPAASRFKNCGDSGPWMPIPTPSVTTRANPRASSVAKKPSSKCNITSKPWEK
jgi:hypothetical protein